MRLLAAAFAISLVFSPAARAADAALIEAAKKEGSVNWYTVQTIPQIVQPLVAGFEKKYGMKVNYIRANSSEVILRVMNEAKAGRVQADVIDGTSMLNIQKDNMLLAWRPDFAKSWAPEISDPKNFWVATNYFVNNIGINTELVAPKDEPKPDAAHKAVAWTLSFAALLDETRAKALALTIRVDNKPVHVVKGTRDGVAIWRVVYGPFTTRDEAERAGRKTGLPFWVYEDAP